MRYEVEQQISEIDNAMFLLNLLNDDSMDNPTEEELTESLKMATSCMKLMMQELAKKNITLKELNKELRGESHNHDEMLAEERKKVIDEAISRISALREKEYDERDEAHNSGIDHAIVELEQMKGGEPHDK